MTSRRVYAILMLALTFGIPLLMIAPRLIEAREGSQVLSGSGCEYRGEEWVILGPEDGGVRIVQYTAGDHRYKIVPLDDIVVSPGARPEEYRWAQSLGMGRVQSTRKDKDEQE